MNHDPLSPESLFDLTFPTRTRSALLIEQTSGEYKELTGYFHLLQFISQMETAEVLCAVDYLVDNEHDDHLYRLLISCQRALSDYIQTPGSEEFFYDYESAFLNNIETLLAQVPQKGLLHILSQEVLKHIQAIENRNNSGITLSHQFHPFPSHIPLRSLSPHIAYKEFEVSLPFADLPPHIRDQVRLVMEDFEAMAEMGEVFDSGEIEALKAGLHQYPPKKSSPSSISLPPNTYPKAKISSFFIGIGVRNRLHELQTGIGQRYLFHSPSGYEFCNHPQNLRHRPIALDAEVVIYHDDYTRLPRFIATKEENHILLRSYPEVLIDLGIKVNAQRAGLQQKLKTMHHESVVEALKRDLEIDITSISLRSQIFLIEFLHQATTQEIEDFNATVRSLDFLQKPSFLTCFFACAHNPELAQRFITIAQNPDQRNNFLSTFLNFSSALESASKSISREQNPLFRSFQNQFIQIVSVHFIKAFTIAQPQDQYQICTRFIKDVRNAVEIFIHLTQTLRDICSRDQDQCERAFRESAEAQLTTMIDKWHYPNISESLHEQIFQRLEYREMSEGACLPVGVSRKDKENKAVERGQKKALKSAHMLAQIFWMNAQDKNCLLAVCDNNALPEDDAQKARIQRIGAEDVQTYTRVKDYFGLQNISITNCQDLIDPEKFAHYHRLVEMLSHQEYFAPAFEKAAQAPPSANQNNTLPYLKEEIAWIWATPHQKITHHNEAKYGYDPIACVFQNMERIAGPQVWEAQNSDDFRLFLCRVLYGLRNQLDERIQSGSPSEIKYYQAFKDFCFGKKQRYKKTRKNPQKAPKAAFDLKQICPPDTKRIKSIKNIEIPFIVPPELSAKSFGNSPQYRAGSVTTTDPYNTLFVNPQNPAPDLHSLPMENIEGIEDALLARTDPAKQNHHLETVIIPLLRAYTANLPHFSPAYFHRFGNSQNFVMENIVHQLNEISTYIECLRFIKKYVLLPPQ